ncbi:MAG TPA: MAPEG family protein [Burkholderiales bacterium]
MKPELNLLVWATVLTLVQAVIAVHGALMQVGLPMLAGNREGMPEIKGWGGRAARAHRNMLENLVLFAILVIAAVLADKTNGTTLLGAQIFLYARVAYALVYIAGLPWIRTGVWAVSVVGLAMIFLQLI